MAVRLAKQTVSDSMHNDLKFASVVIYVDDVSAVLDFYVEKDSAANPPEPAT